MTLLVAGVHGVGKSYLCTQYAELYKARHESASSLIRQERRNPLSKTDKKVADIEANQLALAAAVLRILDGGQQLVLDGHFVLIDQRSGLVPLDDTIFAPLRLIGVVLIEAEHEIIANRLMERDGSKSVVDIEKFVAAERAQAVAVTEKLGIPLNILDMPSFDEFAAVVNHYYKFVGMER